MRSILLAMVLALLAQSSLASTDWPNEPAGATQLLDCGFDQEFVQASPNYNPLYYTTCDGELRDPLGSITRTLSKQQDPTAPFSPAGVIRSSLFYPSKSGGTQLEYRASQDITEVFVGLWWRSSPQFDGSMVGANKMFFIRGGNNQNGVFMWQKSPGSLSTSRFYWTTQLPYNLDRCGGTDVDQCFNNVASVNVVPGTWYRIEVYIKASSCPTCKDGTVRWWITPKGGQTVLGGDYKNFAYGPLVSEWVWAETWDGGGSGTGFGTDVYHQLDHLHISQPHGAIDPVIPLSISTGALPAGRLGVAYSATLQAANGKAPYGWTITGGSLLPGLTLNKTTGLISGTPTACGRCDFTVKVMDATAPAAEATRSFYLIASGTNCASRMENSRESENGIRIGSRAGNVRFNLPSVGANVLSVYDLSGRVVWSRRGDAAQKAEISMENKLKQGIYVARLYDGTKNSMARFIITE